MSQGRKAVTEGAQMCGLPLRVVGIHSHWASLGDRVQPIRVIPK